MLVVRDSTSSERMTPTILRLLEHLDLIIQFHYLNVVKRHFKSISPDIIDTFKYSTHILKKDGIFVMVPIRLPLFLLDLVHVNF